MASNTNQATQQTANRRPIRLRPKKANRHLARTVQHLRSVDSELSASNPTQLSQPIKSLSPRSSPQHQAHQVHEAQVLSEERIRKPNRGVSPATQDVGVLVGALQIDGGAPSLLCQPRGHRASHFVMGPVLLHSRTKNKHSSSMWLALSSAIEALNCWPLHNSFFFDYGFARACCVVAFGHFLFSHRY